LHKRRTLKRSIVRLTSLALLAFALSLSVGSVSHATTHNKFQETREDIDRLYELARKGENYEEALDGIVGYVERGDVDTSNRIRALLRLQQLAAPELKDYLLQLSRPTMQLENSGQLRAYVHRAYWATVLAEAQNETEEEQILLKALNATFDVEIDGRKKTVTKPADFVRTWAADKLCRRGKTEHFDAISSALDKSKRNPRAQQRIELCRRQMELINRFDSPLATMEFILQEVDPIAEQMLVDWAINELVERQPANLDDLLIEYILRLEETPDIEDRRDLFFKPIALLRQRGWDNNQLLERGFNSIK
jgi:hypothetical protein